MCEEMLDKTEMYVSSTCEWTFCSATVKPDDGSWIDRNFVA